LQQIDSERDSSALRILIGNRLIEKIDKAETLSDRLKDLKYLKTETEKERKAIALKNRSAFHKKHGLF